MKFIDIEQRAPKGRGFSDEIHRSTLQTEATGLQVLGVIPHGNMIRPATSADRDKMIEHLRTLEYMSEGCGVKGPKGYICTHHENGKHIAYGCNIDSVCETWPITEQDGG